MSDIEQIVMISEIAEEDKMRDVDEVSIVIDRQQTSTPFDSPLSVISQMGSPTKTDYCSTTIDVSPHRLAVMTVEEYQTETTSPRSKRKQGHPHRAIKQLASLADKIINGIIVIEPRMAWEDYRTNPANSSSQHHRHHYSSGGGAFLEEPAAKRSRSSTPSRGRSSRKERAENVNVLRSPVSDADRSPSPNPSQSRAVSPSPSSNPNSKPSTMIGRHIPDDHEPVKLSARVELYHNIYRKRKSPGSLALLGTNRLSGFGGTPLDISAAPGASLLDDSEFELCSLLRLQPLQYFQSRDTLLTNLRERGYYRKSAAQKMLHIDVNKTGRLYDFFVKMGWMPETEEAMSAGQYSNPPEVDWQQILP